MGRRGGRRHPPRSDRRLLIVSHPCVLAVNQAVYLAMKQDGWDPRIVVPDRWRHEYAPEPFPAEVLAGLEGAVHPLRVAFAGRAQRHFHLALVARAISQFRPAAVFIEQEPFSVPALQWGIAAHRAGLPFGVQADENLDRVLPRPARLIRSWVLRHAAFVAARSPAAADLVRRWGSTGRTELVPHAVPGWDVPERTAGGSPAPFTIGFAGRLVPEKGLWDLVSAARLVEQPVRLLLVGDGPLRSELAAAVVPGGSVEVRTDVNHSDMPAVYAEMDVLVLPSRTTPAWAEQFGRVLVEALWCGIPVVGSSSGEIPWVLSATSGGLVFPEGDVAALAGCLAQLRHDPDLRARLANQGRAAVERTFSASACGAALAGALTVALAERPPAAAAHRP